MLDRGVTLIEILAASLIGALLAGGTLTAFVMAAKLSQGASSKAEATSFAQDALEQYRNRIAADDTWTTAFASNDCVNNVGWVSEPLPAGAAPSIQSFGATRQYCGELFDCDGVGGAGDCYRIMVRVQWNQPQ